MSWRDRARQIMTTPELDSLSPISPVFTQMLTTPELASALATLSVLTQRRQEQASVY